MTKAPIAADDARLPPEQSVRLIALSKPESVQSWNWFGNWAANQKQFDIAASAFHRAHLIAPSSGMELGKAIAMLARRQDHATIAEVLGREGRSRSLSAELYRALSASQIKLSRAEEALATLSTATARYPNDLPLHGALADHLISLARPSDAEAVLRTATALPGSDDATVLKLASLLAGTRSQEAVTLLRDAVSRYPTSLAVRRRLAALLQAQDRFDEAERELRAIADWPDADAETLLQLADVLDAIGRLDDVVEILVAARSTHPDHIGVRHRLTEALVAANRLDHAENELRSALACPSANAMTHLALARVLVDQGRPAEALTLLQRALERFTRDPDVRRLLVTTLIALDRLDEADAELKRASDHFSHDRRLSMTFQAGHLNLDVLKRCRSLGRPETAFVRHTEHDVFTAMCSKKGFYHNYQLHDGAMLLDRYGKMTNSPRATRPFNFVEWDIIKRHVVESGAHHIADIGSADGYFSVQCAQLGCQVDAYEPSEMFHARTQLFSAYFGVADRIVASNTTFAPHTQRRARYDLILALGVIYHFNSLIRGLRDLARSSDRLIIETTGGDVPGFNDHAATQFRDHHELSLTWLISFLERQGFDVEYVDEWNGYIRQTKVIPERHMLICRRRTLPA